METNTETKTNPFKEWIENLPVKDYFETKTLVIQKCYITPQVFRHWKNGNSAIPELAKPIINEIAGYEVFTINK